MNPVEASQALPLKQSRIISSVLSPAVQLWLRSQVQQVEDLQVKIEGSDRAILKGYVPSVSISARHAVYQGLYLRQIQLVAQEIRINLGQIVKGKPLRLLEPVPVTGELFLSEADLNASLASSLLANALTEFLRTLLQAAEKQRKNLTPNPSPLNGEGRFIEGTKGTGETDELGGITNSVPLLKDQSISWQKIELGNGWLTISGIRCDASGNEIPVMIRAHFGVENGRQLHLAQLQIESPLGVPLTDLNSFQIDLGSEVEIQELTLSAGQLVCRGGAVVRTEE